MRVCKVDGHRTMRLAKQEQDALTLAAELLHTLAFYDDTLQGIATDAILVVQRLDAEGVYRPRSLDKNPDA